MKPTSTVTLPSKYVPDINIKPTAQKTRRYIYIHVALVYTHPPKTQTQTQTSQLLWEMLLYIATCIFKLGAGCLCVYGWGDYIDTFQIVKAMNDM